jgi:DNA polymerase III sliding clamp (beta) subunit (PCNA family)
LKIGRFRATFWCVSFKELDDIRDLLPEPDVSIPASMCLAISQALWCTCLDGAIPYFAGVNIDSKFVYAIDSKRILRIKHGGDSETFVGFLPNALCETILPNMEESGAIVAETENLIVLRCENILIFSAKACGTWPDVKSFFDSIKDAKNENEVVDFLFDPDKFRGALDRVALLAKSNFGSFIKLAAEGSRLRISSVDTSGFGITATAQEIVDLTADVSSPIDVDVQTDFIVDAMKHFDRCGFVPLKDKNNMVLYFVRKGAAHACVVSLHKQESAD